MNYFSPTLRRALILLIGVLAWVSIATAQDDAGSAGSGAAPAATAPAEQNNVENPPLSGLDAPTAEPAFGGRSYLVPGLQVSESVDSNAASAANNNSHTSEITRALGSVDMQKIWRQYQFGLDYIAGGDFYAGARIATNHGRATQVHTLAANQRILWRTGQLAIRDSFDYLPEGTFGFSSYGGAGGFGSAIGGGVTGVGAGTGVGSGLAGGSAGGVGTSFGSIGYQPRIDNSSVIDVVQGLSPRSTVTLAGGYSFTNYLDTIPTLPLVNSQQITGQVGFNRILNRKDQVGVQYAYQDFHFPRVGSGTVQTHTWNALYGHRISGKLNLTVAGGPQLIVLNSPLGTTKKLTANGSLTFAYSVSALTSVQVVYQRYVSPGSGFYAGANTDAARLSLGHLFGRHWTTTTDVGYSHNSSVQSASVLPPSGLTSHSYQFWYAGTSLQRRLGQQFSFFVSYQFNDMGLSQCTTGPTSVCSGTSTRHTGQVGINWHPKPIRLD
jgi:hypothetical protein